MIGPIVNFLAIIIGGALGLPIKRGISERYKAIIMQAIPLSVLFLGAAMSLGGLLDKAAEPLLFITSMVLGGICGEWLRIEQRLEKLGQYVQVKLGRQDDHGFAEGFITTSLIFCVGAMAILGSLESGMHHNHRILFAKSILDGITSLILASTFGLGVLFSAVPVLLYQGAITALAGVALSGVDANIIREITIIGGMLIFAIGSNMLEFTKIKIANLLPAILVPVLYYLPPVHNLFVRIGGMFTR